MLGPSTRPDLPVTTTFASALLAAASTDTAVVRAGTTIVPPSATGTPLILKIFSVVSLDGRVTNRFTEYVLTVVPSAAVTVTTTLLSPATRAEPPEITTLA